MDLKKFLDPLTRHIFFSNGVFSFACQIVHVENCFLYFTAPNDLPNEVEQGHFVALEGMGIVTFKNPNIESLSHESATRLGVKLYRINFENQNYLVSNRRLTERREMTDFIPIAFNVYGESLAAQLVNISTGGLRMCVETPLKKNVACQLEIRLPTKDGEIFLNTNGVVVYADASSHQRKAMVGIHFVTPEFVSEDEKMAYMKSMDALRNYTAHI